MPEFYEIVHARVRDGIEEEMAARRPALEAAVFRPRARSTGTLPRTWPTTAVRSR